MERREIQRFHDLKDPLEWTFEDEHGHELFHRGEGESAQEMEAAGYREFFPDRFIDEIWIAEEHAGCGEGGSLPSSNRVDGRSHHPVHRLGGDPGDTGGALNTCA
jgi:hypothetical protein